VKEHEKKGGASFVSSTVCLLRQLSGGEGGIWL
jgi:hypothetical protein